MKNIFDMAARYIATILISALSVTADADYINEQVKKYTAKNGNGVRAVQYLRNPTENLSASSKLKPSHYQDSE